MCVCVCAFVYLSAQELRCSELEKPENSRESTIDLKKQLITIAEQQQRVCIILDFSLYSDGNLDIIIMVYSTAPKRKSSIYYILVFPLG